MPKIFVGLPAYGRMNCADTTGSLYELGVTLGMNGLFGGFGLMGYPDIVKVRNVFVTKFFEKTDATHILQIDADMRFSSKMIIDMLDFQKPVVGAIYRRRSDHGWVGSKIEGEVPQNGFLKVEGVGAGVLLISRECLQTMKEHFPPVQSVHAKTAGLTHLFPFFDPVTVDGEELSEDLSFCHRWRSIGGEVFASVAHDVGHIGPWDFHGRYQDQFNA